jgi:hypothetical protein
MNRFAWYVYIERGSDTSDEVESPVDIISGGYNFPDRDKMFHSHVHGARAT